MPLFLALGVRGSEREVWRLCFLGCRYRKVLSSASAAISSSVMVDRVGELGEVEVGVGDAESSMKPIPGVNGGWFKDGRVEGSSFRRHERARTPAKRMTVPRAIYEGLVTDCQVDLRDFLTRRPWRRVSRELWSK